MVRRRPDSTGVVPGGQQPRFPGFDVLGQVDAWDAVTAGVILARLGPPPPFRFFSPAEEAIGNPLVDAILAQRDDPKIPVLRMIDARLAEGQTDGWHYADLPEDGNAWHRTLRHLDEDAADEFSRGFALLGYDQQESVVGAVQAGDGPWHGLDREHVWSLWTRYACTAFYSHPWAWNEIGFSGPAYPRGYKNIGIDRREPWEVADHRPLDPVDDEKTSQQREHSMGAGT